MYLNNNLPLVINNYLNYLSVIKGVSQGTLTQYGNDISMLMKFLKIYYNETETDDVSLIDITDINEDFIKRIKIEDLYAFLNFTEKYRKNSATTRARKVICIKSFFNYLYKRAKIIESNIGSELESPKKPERLPIYLNSNEAIKLLNSVESRNHERDFCILTFFLNTGIRLSELCSINISNVNTVDCSLTIIGKGDKERIVYLNSSCIKAYLDYIEIRSTKVTTKEHKDALFLSEQRKRINKRTVENVVNNAIEKAGLSDKYSTHKLRHTAATLMYKAGADIRSIQIILGHSTISTTQKYVHVCDEQMRKAVDINPLNNRG